MSTLKLETAIEEACRDLSWVQKAVASVRASGTLLDESYRFFESTSDIANQLEHAKHLLPVRQITLQAATEFPTKVSVSSGKFLFNGMDVTFRQGRYLLVQNYMATTWALYDAVAKEVGALCVPERERNNSKPAKLPEGFLREKPTAGGRIQDHLKNSYGWPIALSYAVRNWFVHDGFKQNGQDLFRYDAPLSSPFEICDDAWDVISTKCTQEYKASATQTRKLPFPDVKMNLVGGLQLCHEEVDEALGFLLKWAAGSVRLQATILFLRDPASPPPPGNPVTPPPTP